MLLEFIYFKTIVKEQWVNIKFSWNIHLIFFCFKILQHKVFSLPVNNVTLSISFIYFVKFRLWKNLQLLNCCHLILGILVHFQAIKLILYLNIIELHIFHYLILCKKWSKTNKQILKFHNFICKCSVKCNYIIYKF